MDGNGELPFCVVEFTGEGKLCVTGDFGPGLLALWLSVGLTRRSCSRAYKTSDISGRNFASRMHCNARIVVM